MKIIFPVFTALFIFCGCRPGNKKEVIKTEIESADKTVESDCNCKWKKVRSSMDTTFPYNRADKIEIISAKLNPYFGIVKMDSLDKFNIIGLLEKIELNDKQKDSLFSILYNFKGEGCTSAACFDPRHAILFYEKEKAIAQLQVCIHCQNIEIAPGKWNPGTFCDNSWDMFENYLKWIGIKEGLRTPVKKISK